MYIQSAFSDLKQFLGAYIHSIHVHMDELLARV